MTTTAGRYKVLWLIKGLGPGGAETLLVSTARVADTGRFEYQAAYVLPWKDQLVPALQRSGVATHCLGTSASDLRWPASLRRLLREQRFDVVHVHSPLLAGVVRLLVRTLPRSVRPAVVSTEHNTWSSFALPTRLLNALLFRTDAHRFAVSDDVRTSIWPALRRDVEVLVHGLVLDDAARSRHRRDAIRAELGFAPGQVVIGTVANYRAQKGYPDLLEAAAAVLQSDPRARFLAAGQGPLEAEINALHSELGLGQGFQLLGYRTDALDLLSACDVFVLASHHEGFPIALMEALAVGTPVVATRVGGIPDAVVDGDSGLLVAPGRPQELAAALGRMVADDELRSRCAAGALSSGDRYDIRRAVARMEEVYETVATDRADRMPSG